nr:hypothetical protein [Tanacetum cinerariifolium]
GWRFVLGKVVEGSMESWVRWWIGEKWGKRGSVLGVLVFAGGEWWRSWGVVGEVENGWEVGKV